MDLGDKLRQLRQDRNWTQPELAESLGIEQSYLSKLENGKSLPSNDSLNRILDVFGLDIGELVDDLDQRARNQLRQIPDVAQHFARQKAMIIGNRRRWLIGSSLLAAIGAALIYAGAVGSFAGDLVYTYRSDGIVRDGESKDIFVRGLHSSGSVSEFLQLRERLEERLDADFLQTRTYRGDIFNVPVEGGSRTYQLTKLSPVEAWQNNAAAAVGVLLAAFGVTCIGLEKKLSRFQ